MPLEQQPIRVRATVEYDGTAFLGFQRQAAGRTVQEALERALGEAAGATVRVIAAGRTDSGVHAAGQVVHFDYAGRVPVERLAATVNGLLPPDVAVLQASLAGPGFHARHSALSRTYRYRYFRSASPSPLRERYRWRVDGPLDLDRMSAGTTAFLGEHSFRAFGDIPGSADQRQRSRQRHGWRRFVYRSELAVRDEEVCFTVEANAFLTHMVRSMAGVLVAIGRQRLPLEMVAAALEDESVAKPLAPLAPPHGLCLVRVRYADDDKPGGEHGPARTE